MSYSIIIHDNAGCIYRFTEAPEKVFQFDYGQIIAKTRIVIGWAKFTSRLLRDGPLMDKCR